MTQPVEPSDPTKARITAVSFAGSSGLNVDLSVDGGDNNDDYIGGFLQNYSPDAMQEFTVRTSQFDADTSRTNGGSVIISTRRGYDQWHGDLGAYFRERALNARNDLDNPAPNPKQPFSRENGVATIGGPIRKGKLWLFSSFEHVHEDASVAYSAQSLDEFRALARIAAAGLIPGVAPPNGLLAALGAPAFGVPENPCCIAPLGITLVIDGGVPPVLAPEVITGIRGVEFAPLGFNLEFSSSTSTCDRDGTAGFDSGICPRRR